MVDNGDRVFVEAQVIPIRRRTVILDLAIPLVVAEMNGIRYHSPMKDLTTEDKDGNIGIPDETIPEEAMDSVTPLDLLDSDNYTNKEERDRRYDTCKACDRLFKPTRTCKECGCFMSLKTWLKDATCPLGKW